MPSVWASRREVVERALDSGASDAARWLGREYLETLTAYEAEATRSRLVVRRDSAHDAVRDSRTEGRLEGQIKGQKAKVRAKVKLGRKGQSRVAAVARSLNPRRVTKAGTITRRSTTGRMRGRSASATCPSGGIWRCTVADLCWSSVAAQVVSRCRSGGLACHSSASIARARCCDRAPHAAFRRARARLARGASDSRRHQVPARSTRRILDGARAVRAPAVTPPRA